MKSKSYKDLIVWQKSMELVKEVYLLTAQLPVEERFGLISQMRRAVISIPSTIAEGYMRKHKIGKMLNSMIYKLEGGTKN